MRSAVNGRNWSAPLPIRPLGGNGQTIWGAAAEPEGGLIVLAGDNGAFTSLRPTMAIPAPPPAWPLVMRVWRYHEPMDAR